MFYQRLGILLKVQVVRDGEEDDDSQDLTFYLDGAHTPESMATCAHWFADSSSSRPKRSVHSSGQFGSSAPAAESDVQRVMIFNCMEVLASTSQCRCICTTH